MIGRSLIAALLLATAASAKGSISDEVTLGTSQSGNSNVGSVGDSLNAYFDLSDDWSVSLGAMTTFEGGVPAAPNTTDFDTDSSQVSSVSFGVDWLPNDHWSFGFSGAFQPPATLQVSAPFSAPRTAIDPNLKSGSALIDVRSWMLNGALDASYDTAGESDLEWSLGMAVAFSHLGTKQTAVEAKYDTVVDTKPVDAAQLRVICARNGARCTRQIRAALAGDDHPLDSERFSPSVTATAWQDTDFRVSFDYYVYNEDTADQLFVRVSAYGPIAPLQWQLKPEVTHRFGDFSLRLWFAAGRYAPGTGADKTAALGLRAQYKFTREFRLWVTVSGQRDSYDQAVASTTVEMGSPSNSGTIALGGAYRW
jgi:hypothetical protein